MAKFSISNVSIRGIAACVPKQVFHNKNYDWINEKDRANLIRTIGVERKRHASEGVISSDLCLPAAEQIIRDLSWDKSEIDILVFVSQTRDYYMPATACILQDKLGLSKDCVAFDLDMGCSGYVYGLSVVYSMLAAGHLKKALLLAGEVPTPNVNYKDKSTFPLFGDAGTATAIEFDTKAAITHFNLQTDGKGYEAIMIPDGGMRNFIDPEKTFKEGEISEGIIRHRGQIALNGMDVFNFTLKEVRPNIKALLNYAEMEMHEIDYLVFHQANKLMNETIRKQLKVEAEKYLYSIEEFGNTSSASIPLTITYSQQAIKRSAAKFLFSGFGVGLSWGSVICTLDNVKLSEIIEI